MCKRRKRDAQKDFDEETQAISRLVSWNYERHGWTRPNVWRFPDDREPDWFTVLDNDIEMVQAAGESFTAREAIVAAIEVATALAFNNERGFEKLINTEHEPDNKIKKRSDLWEEAILRLAYIADPTVIPCRTRMAASTLGGITALRGLIPGKDGMPNVGHVYEAAQRRCIDRMWLQILQKKKRCMFSDRARDQCREFLKIDDKALAAICDAALAAACVAHIIEKNVCQLDADHLKSNMFRGGCWASGNLPTWE